LHRAEIGTERATRRRAWWLDTFASDRDSARDYVRSHGCTVRDVMTRDVITVTETTELDEVADLLETKRVKRVPLVRDGKVIGIVSRADLVRALTTAKSLPSTDTDADDRTIRARLQPELQGQEWAKVQAGDVIVRDKVVHLWCSDDKSEGNSPGHGCDEGS
jgi:CBS domain-containing protein